MAKEKLLFALSVMSLTIGIVLCATMHSFAEFGGVNVTKELEEKAEQEAEQIVDQLESVEKKEFSSITQDGNPGERYDSASGLAGVKLYVLVSSSMPDSMVSSYIAEATRYNAHLVLNGLVENDFYKTAKYFLRMKREQGGFAVDSRIFEQYGVTKVPAIVLAKDSGEYDIVRGAVSIRHALVEMSRRGGLAYEALLLLSR